MDSGGKALEVFLYFPSVVGFVIVVLACIFAPDKPHVIIYATVGVVCHLFSSLVIWALIGIGEAWGGQGGAHDFAAAYCVAGLIAYGIPLIIRSICTFFRRANKKPSWER